jgi:hypothetical protein
MSESQVLDAIKARALEQREVCRGAMGDDTIAECWSAILNAANELDPPLHGAITRSAIDTTRARSTTKEIN